jgi:hypothetical protein
LNEAVEEVRVAARREAQAIYAGIAALHTSPNRGRPGLASGIRGVLAYAALISVHNRSRYRCAADGSAVGQTPKR